MLAERKPHIGEYATKTNAIRAPRQTPAAPGNGRRQAFEGGSLGVLLAVIDQDLIAGLGQLGAILLKAIQNGEVRFVHDGTAKFLNVVSAGLLLLRRSAMLLLLGDGRTRDRQRHQSDYQERSIHRVPLFFRQKFPAPIAHGISEADQSDFEKPLIATHNSTRKCGQICTDSLPKSRALDGKFREARNRLVSRSIFVERCARGSARGENFRVSELARVSRAKKCGCLNLSRLSRS